MIEYARFRNIRRIPCCARPDVGQHVGHPGASSSSKWALRLWTFHCSAEAVGLTLWMVPLSGAATPSAGRRPL